MSNPDENESTPNSAALKGSLLAQLPWQSAVAGGLVTRFSTANMIPEQIDAYLNKLREYGFHPKIHKSETLGPTIRLHGTEAAIMQQAHDEAEVAKKIEAPRPGPS